ncbi:hypothetical protein AB0L06_23655 [Spirillospora sp. NPDC052269]
MEAWPARARTSCSSTSSVPTSFTGRFLALVRDGVQDGPETLTLGDLHVHLRRRLAAHDLPAPNRRGTDTADRHPFTRSPGTLPTARLESRSGVVR